MVSEICLLMFGLGKWKPLWRARRINPAFLVPGVETREGGGAEWGWCWGGGDEQQIPADFAPTHRRRKRHQLRNV